jgi:hypothetical protein
VAYYGKLLDYKVQKEGTAFAQLDASPSFNKRRRTSVYQQLCNPFKYRGALDQHDEPAVVNNMLDINRRLHSHSRGRHVAVVLLFCKTAVTCALRNNKLRTPSQHLQQQLMMTTKLSHFGMDRTSQAKSLEAIEFQR